MKKSLFASVAIAAALILGTTPLHAGKGGAGGFAGKLGTVTADSITVSNKKAGDKTFKITPTTTFMKADGTAGTIDDIKAAKMVKVTPAASADEAASVAVFAHKAGAKGGKGAGADAGGGAAAGGGGE